MKQMKEFKTKSELYAEYVRLKEKYEPEPVIEKKQPNKEAPKVRKVRKDKGNPKTIQYFTEEEKYVTAYIKKPEEGKWLQIDYPKEDYSGYIKIWIRDTEEEKGGCEK